MKIVVLDGFALNPGDLSWDGFKPLGELVIYDRTLPDETYQRAAGADVLITNKVDIDETLIKKLPGLKYIGVLATGYNIIDVEAAKRAGITVTNIPAYSTRSVAQMVFAHILNFSQRIGLHNQLVKEGVWSGHADFCFWRTPQIELSGKTLGIVGFGLIGREVARIGDAFGMQVIFNSRSFKDNYPPHYTQATLHEVLAKSDFVSLNCPLNNENMGFINRETIALMKPTAFLVNTGRGQLINEVDLAEALNDRKIAGAGLDVLSKEPPPAKNPLLTARNCFITPHIAWATFEARSRLMEIATENLRAFQNGAPVNVV